MADVLAIVGSVSFVRPDALNEARHIIEGALDRNRPDAIVSGGAEGIDSLAEAIATDRGITMIVHRPKDRRWQPDGFKDRNLLIVRDCTRLLAIRCAQSKTYGSGWTADQAERAGRPVWRVTL
jgi:hypothetical protein